MDVGYERDGWMKEIIPGMMLGRPDGHGRKRIVTVPS